MRRRGLRLVQSLLRPHARNQNRTVLCPAADLPAPCSSNEACSTSGRAASSCSTMSSAKATTHRPNHGFATKAEEYDVIRVDAGLAQIEGYDAGGFLINNAYLEGAVLLSGDLSTLWRVSSFADMTEDSLSLLLMMRPAPDLLVLGCGPKMELMPQALQQWLASHGIAVECLNTGNAVSTFNILNQEGRKVAAALLPSN